MPPRYRRSTYRRRRTTRRVPYRRRRTTTRRRTRPNTLVRAAGLKVMPNRVLVKLPHAVSIGTTTTTSPDGVLWQFTNLNQVLFGITSPRYPKGLDKYAQIYSRYRVIGASYKMTASCLTSGQSGIYGISWKSNPDIDTTLNEFMTDQASKYRHGTFGARPVVIKGYLRPWTIMGVAKRQYMTDDDFAATLFYDNDTNALTVNAPVYTTNALVPPQVQFFFQGADQTTSVGHQVWLETVYYVIFDQPPDITLYTTPG